MEENKSKIKANILQYVEIKGLSKRKFYSETGIANGFLDNSSGVTEATIEKILQQYSDINPVWLITGRGSMLTGVHADTGEKAYKLGDDKPLDIVCQPDFTLLHKKPAEQLKAPKMGNYAADRINDEKNRIYEAQITRLEERIDEANRIRGRLEATIEELQAKLEANKEIIAGLNPHAMHVSAVPAPDDLKKTS